MIDRHEGKNLRKTIKRTLYFMVAIFIICLPECYLLILAGLSAAVNGIIIICTAAVLYLLFLIICAKIDKKRERDRLESPTKDPFSKQ